MIRIEIAAKEVITRRKKDNSGDYYQQIAYAYTVDRDGVEDAYPVKVLLMLGKDKNTGNPIPYDVGMYTLAPSSLRVNQYSRLEVGFLSLRSLREKPKSSAS